MNLSEKLLVEAKKIRDVRMFSGMKNVQWESPSNIALVKYWGKKAIQIPQNPSLSFGLKNSKTITNVTFSIRGHSNYQFIDIDFYFDGIHNPEFGQRIEKYLNSLLPYFPFLIQLKLKIESKNTFPHSSGIASSASAMSALALCICSIERKLFNTLTLNEDFLQKASFIARLGSGSAARSIYPSYVLWGQHPNFIESSNEYATPIQTEIAPIFQNIHDAILITSKEKKKISSSNGHLSMEGHPFAGYRYKQARKNLKYIIEALKIGNWDLFSSVCEQEALGIHAMMLSAKNSYTLMNKHSWEIIRLITEARTKEKLPVCFTLDAGPNVHLLYPAEQKTRVLGLINNSLKTYCMYGYWIDDKMGNGATYSGK